MLIDPVQHVLKCFRLRQINFDLRSVTANDGEVSPGSSCDATSLIQAGQWSFGSHRSQTELGGGLAPVLSNRKGRTGLLDPQDETVSLGIDLSVDSIATGIDRVDQVFDRFGVGQGDLLRDTIDRDLES
jgi:hypothetical protein